jgi:hypothetical protein
MVELMMLIFKIVGIAVLSAALVAVLAAIVVVVYIYVQQMQGHNPFL